MRILPRTALRPWCKRVDHRLIAAPGPSCLLVSKKSITAEEEGVKLNTASPRPLRFTARMGGSWELECSAK